MKIQYNGASAVDVPGHDDVQPGAVIDVADEVGASLLAAGTAYPDDGSDCPLCASVARPSGEEGRNPHRNG